MIKRGSSPAQGDLRQFSPATLTALMAATRTVNQSSDLGRTLEAILEQALRLLDAPEGSVMRLRSDASTLIIGAARGLPDEVVRSTQIRVGQGISGYVASSGNPLLLGSDEEVSRYQDGQTEGRHLLSALSVPMKTNGRVVGVLNVNLVDGRTSRGPFDENDLQIASAFAEIAATAVRQAQLYASAKSRGDDLALLYEAGAQLAAAATVEEVADRLLDASRDLLGSHAGFVVAFPSGEARPDPVRIREIAQGRVMAVIRRQGTLAELVKDEAPRVVPDVESDTALRTIGVNADPAGAVSVPLRGPTGVVGLLVALTSPGGPPETRVRLLTTFATPAALALGRALLLRDIQSKEDELTSLAVAVPDPIVITDAEGRLIALNPVASELFGLNPAFDLGMPISGRLHSDELEELVLGNEPIHTEMTLLTPEPRTFRVRVTTARPEAGPAGSRIMILEDVTQEREMAKLKSDFVAVIGHELRTPLTLVRGYAKTLVSRGEALPPEARQTAVAAIAKQSGRLERLVEDLLLISQVERHRPPLHLEERPVGEVIAETVSSAREEHPSRTFTVDAPQGPVLAMDVVKVEQVMQQFLDNAVKFSDEGDIEIAVKPNADEVRVSVRDSGVGIFSGDLPRLFQRFHQIDGTGTRAYGGTGIGLYICKTLVDVWGGRIGVDSALGHGSTFWFTIPAAPPSQDTDVR